MIVFQYFDTLYCISNILATSFLVIVTTSNHNNKNKEHLPLKQVVFDGC